MPSLDESDKSGLERNITLTEIDNAIEPPGPDGYPSELFKKFAPKLLPLLVKVFEEVLVRKALPPTMTQASLSLLLKKNKDPLLCAVFILATVFDLVLVLVFRRKWLLVLVTF